MYWKLVSRTDTRARLLADRHYSRKSPGHPEFCPPGDNIVLLGLHNDALWVSHRPHPGALETPRADGLDYWDNPYFRNESDHLASDLIVQALGITIQIWGEPFASDGFHSFISTKHVRPTKRRGKNIWGYVYILAGFEPYPTLTKSRGLIRMILSPVQMAEIEPASPVFEQGQLF